MREIKFRAWHKGVKIMQLVVNLDWSTIGDRKIDGLWSIEGIDIVKTRSSGGSTKFVRQEDYVLMQWTGLLDKNGKEIYENDYLEIPEVSDNSKTWCVFWGSGKYILQNISTGDILDCNETNTNKKEGGGNRYENPREHKAVASDL